MSTLTITGSFPDEAILNFAKAKGYVSNDKQTADAFVGDYFVSKIANEITEATIMQLVKVTQDRMQSQIGITMQNIKQQLTLTIE